MSWVNSRGNTHFYTIGINYFENIPRGGVNMLRNHLLGDILSG